MRRRSYGYRTRNEYYTNAEGQEVMLKLINDIAANEPIVKSNLSEIKKYQDKITMLEKEENETRNDKYARMREIHIATQARVKNFLIESGHYVNYIDINSEYTKLEIMLGRYNSTNMIKLEFGEYDFRNRYEIAYYEKINFSFQNLSFGDASRVFSLGNFIIANIGQILDIMSDGFCDINDIRENVKLANHTEEINKLKNRMGENYDTVAECIQMAAIMGLATKRNAWFDKYISATNNNHIRYAVIKDAKYRTDKRVDNFTQFIQTKNKFMLVNGDSQDFLEISKSKIAKYIPVIMAGSTEIAFDLDQIKTAIRTKYNNN